MSGGEIETMAAYSKNIEEKSGFSDADLNKYSGYFDKYSEDSTAISYENRILGDAIGEAGPFYLYYDKNGARIHYAWNGDMAEFVELANPWLVRGGNNGHGVLAGPFLSARRDGSLPGTFRVVLSPV